MKHSVPSRILRYTATISSLSAALVLALGAAGCSSDGKSITDPDAVAAVYDHVLTRAQLRQQMPVSVSQADSARLARALINEWIETNLMSHAAANDVDIKKIERLVQEYRNELLAMEYTRLMYDTHASEIPEDSLQAYYEANKEEFKLTRPMVKGVYIKAANNVSTLPQMKRLYTSHKDADIDRLDKIASNTAVHYDYFRDKWIDWEQIESRVPYDFGPSADAFLRHRRTVDYSQGGFTYLIDITDVLHPGQTMPYEAARASILDRLRFIDRRSYTLQLKKSLYEDALENGKITLFVDTE